MKKSAAFLALALPAMFLTSCVSLSFNTSHTTSESQTDYSESWTDGDLKHVADSLVQDCVNSTGFSNYIKETGEIPQVIIGPVANKSGEHIDTSKLARRLQTSIINSGAMKVVAAPEHLALYSDNVEDDYYYAFEKLKESALQLGADFIFQGSVTSRIENKDNRQICNFLVEMEILDLQNDKILWQGINDDVKKSLKKSLMQKLKYNFSIMHA